MSDPICNPLVISDETTVTATIRIQPKGKDELKLETGWVCLGDLIDLLQRLRTPSESAWPIIPAPLTRITGTA